MKVCINNHDPRLPNCSPSDVSTFEFDQRDRNANDPADQQNKDNLEWELGQGGLGPYIVQDQQLVYSGAVNDTPDLCSGDIQLFVPMTQRPDGTFRKARRRFRVRAASGDGRVDIDTFTYYLHAEPLRRRLPREEGRAVRRRQPEQRRRL